MGKISEKKRMILEKKENQLDLFIFLVPNKMTLKEI